MHLNTVLIVLLTFTSTCLAHYRQCLSDHDADRLTKQWLRVRSSSPDDTSFSRLLNGTITSDSKFEDETISYFIGGVEQTGPYVTSRAQYLLSRQAGLTISTTDVPLFTLQSDVEGGGARYSCDSITLRWISSSTVNKKNPFSTADIGDAVIYKGIDLLIVNVGRGKIEAVYTSADYIREIKQKGFPPS